MREPDILIYGLVRLDPPEQESLAHSPMRHVLAADIQSKGVVKSAQDALAQLHSDAREFIIHLDLDVIAQEEFPAVNVPGSGGLSFADVQASLTEFAKHKNLLGLDIAQYNPDKDPDGSLAQKLVAFLAEILAARLAALNPPPAPVSAPEGEPDPPALS